MKTPNLVETVCNPDLYEEWLPEVHRLGSVVEFNAWHDGEDVLTHTKKVLKSTMYFAAQYDGSQILQDTVEDHTRYDLLLVGTVLHDIGKFGGLQFSYNGTTAKGHEQKSADMSSSITKRLGLNELEQERVYDIVVHHGDSMKLASTQGEPVGKLPDYTTWANAHDDILPELLLLSYGDLHASSLAQNNPKRFEKFRDFHFAKLMETFY